MRRQFDSFNNKIESELSEIKSIKIEKERINTENIRLSKETVEIKQKNDYRTA